MDQKRQSGLAIALGVIVLLLRDWFSGLFLAGHLILGAACEMLPDNSRELHVSNATCRFLNTKQLFAEANIF
jgi:hypothetical protein